MDKTLPVLTSSLPLLNRERAILEFNRRVLTQAEREDVPLLERLRYICIVSSNMDEFFEVRFGPYVVPGMLDSEGQRPGPQELRDVASAAHELIARQYELLNHVLMPALKREGIFFLTHEERNEAQRAWVRAFYNREVRPLLVPIGLDPAHPFPQVANKSLNFIVKLGGQDAFGRENRIAIVKVPRVLPRVIRLPEHLVDGQQGFVLLSSVIRAHLEDLFLGRTVEAFSQFRVTRDSELAVDEQEVANLRQALRVGLTTRHFGSAVRLEVSQSCVPELSDFLLDQFKLPPEALYRVDGQVNLVRVNAMIDEVDAPHLRFAPHKPGWPSSLGRSQSVFERLRQGDLLLHHPFESFEPVIQFLREAVQDPDVLAIKQTIYRTGAKSVLMDLLLEAARRGKEVTAVVELKARFDEEANINWAEQLESVGAQVVYGIVGLKTHAKLLVVTRREGARLRRYVHLSTGNYNPRTARLYTDLGYLSGDQELAGEADTVFQQLTSLNKIRTPRHLLMAPFTLHRQMLRHLQQVRDAAQDGQTARVVVKANALVDIALIEALVATARAGAEIDLIIRGASILPPGLPGVDGRIRVRSIVGRFLEHSRVFYFRWGKGADDEVLYLASADWMNRNMHRRIEVAWPVKDAALRQRVVDECLVPYLRDECDAWAQEPDGTYRRLHREGGVSAQQALVARYAAAAQP